MLAPSVRIEALRRKIEILRATKKERIAALQGMEDPVERRGQRDRISETDGQISTYEKELSALLLNRTSQERTLQLKVREKQIKLEYKTTLWKRLRDPEVLFSGKLSLRY